MADNYDVFLGLSNTAWTAISSIATGTALVTALLFPISDKLSKRRRIYSAIESEILKNFSVLEKARISTDKVFNSQKVSKVVEMTFILSSISTDYWDRNEQYVSECSLRKFEEYSRVNSSLKELKLFSDELRSDTEHVENLYLIIPALNSVIEKEKAWKSKGKIT